MADLIKLHLGCGPHILPGWKNYDLEPGPGGEVVDLRGPLPDGSNTVDFIFTEHFIEHLTRDEGLGFLKECHRVLKSGGVLRISTPDLATLIFDYEGQHTTKYAPTWNPSSPCAMINEGMRLWGHQFIYDEREIRHITYEAGFRNHVKKGLCSWHTSAFEPLQSIEIRPDHGDLIFEVVKP